MKLMLVGTSWAGHCMGMGMGTRTPSVPEHVALRPAHHHLVEHLFLSSWLCMPASSMNRHESNPRTMIHLVMLRKSWQHCLESTPSLE
ncbi:hypothetical protein AVEN_73767-1 [Araneus ventricosus]|uniref:Uncharacterized protein n=1 Tax=Araneus ventricosus TaxID=182803 RepID=A0A4Y2TPR2_ARAVE|nr:hypothetical protein AVEN_73767-1 [Araneus ventricosus]